MLLRIPEEGQILEGNARYEGYCMDLLTELSKELHFHFRFELVPGAIN